MKANLQRSQAIDTKGADWCWTDDTCFDVCQFLCRHPLDGVVTALVASWLSLA